jgi:NAD(P)-dependent dehydrogenase (short-subunit alcohol dehydrogenase family)
MTVAIVTGASSGIGQSIHSHLKESYLKEIQLFDRVIGVSRHGPDVFVDLSSSFEISSLDQIKDVALLVNCAGVLYLGEDDASNAAHIFNVNFWAAYDLIQLFENDLRKNKGSVINIASVSGVMADPDTPIYGASKAALISLTRSLAVKFAPDIRVNSISPGFFETGLVPEPTPKELIDPVPLGFEAKPYMILPVIDMLLDSPYCTGSNIVVDGGLSIRRV